MIKYIFNHNSTHNFIIHLFIDLMAKQYIRCYPIQKQSYHSIEILYY
jgi:hypothetical protein